MLLSPQPLSLLEIEPLSNSAHRSRRATEVGMIGQAGHLRRRGWVLMVQGILKLWTPVTNGVEVGDTQACVPQGQGASRHRLREARWP